jgi:aminoglycoside N3'-acetyltransferase
VKARTKGEVGAAKSLCSPFDQLELPEGRTFMFHARVISFIDFL